MDMRVRDGIYEHQEADRGSPEKWVRVGYDEQGHPVTITQADRLEVSLLPEGNLLFDFGGHLVTAPPEVAAKVNDALVKHVPDGKGVQVAEQVAQIEQRTDEARQAHQGTVAAFDAEIQTKAEELAAAQDAIKQAEAELATVTAQLEVAEQAAAGSSADVRESP